MQLLFFRIVAFFLLLAVLSVPVDARPVPFFPMGGSSGDLGVFGKAGKALSSTWDNMVNAGSGLGNKLPFRKQSAGQNDDMANFEAQLKRVQTGEQVVKTVDPEPNMVQPGRRTKTNTRQILPTIKERPDFRQRLTGWGKSTSNFVNDKYGQARGLFLPNSKVAPGPRRNTGLLDKYPHPASTPKPAFPGGYGKPPPGSTTNPGLLGGNGKTPPGSPTPPGPTTGGYSNTGAIPLHKATLQDLFDKEDQGNPK